MFCEAPSDVFEPQARELLFRVAQSYLEQARITATELAFDPREHRKILGATTKFQEYLQRVAILQGQSASKPVTERMRHVLDCVDGAMRLAEAQARRQQGGEALDAATLDACAAGGLLEAGIALALALGAVTPGDWAGRATLCASLLSASQEPVAFGLLDQTLAELLRLKASVAVLIGRGDALAVQVRACLAIAGDGDAMRTNRSAIIGEIVRLKTKHRLAAIERAAVENLNAALACAANLAARDPLDELKTTRDLHSKIVALPLLAADVDLADNLSRRMSRLVAPESLEPLLAREIGIGRKLLALVRLYSDIDDANARRYLDAMAHGLIESRDFKDEFFTPGLAHDEKRALVAEASEALQGSAFAETRKQRYREVAALAFADLGQAPGRRLSPRMAAGPEDRVQIMGQRVPLRNWSENGLMFGPFSGVLAPGQSARATVLLRNAYISVGFEAALEIVRFSDGLVGARYSCADPHIRQRIKAHFAQA
jgi:hypothetical protein